MTFALVNTAFKGLFSDSEIRTITPNFYDYDILANANSDTEKYYFENEINFFIFLVTRRTVQKLSRAEQHTYTVEIKYYLENDNEGKNQNKLNDVFEIIHNSINSILGTSWSNSVDFYRSTNKDLSKGLIVLDGKQCFQASFTYEGVKTVTL